MKAAPYARELLLAAAVYALALLVLAAMLAVSARSGLSPGALSRDVASSAGVDPLHGLQSHLGVLAWWSAASVAVFAGWAARGRALDERPRLLIWLGLLTAALAADDQLMVHEALAPYYLGIGERWVVAAYGVVLAAILIRFSAALRAGPGLPLFASGLGLLALSVLVDLLQERWDSEWRVFVEDGFKLLGIAGWSAYLVGLAFAVLGTARVRPVDPG